MQLSRSAVLTLGRLALCVTLVLHAPAFACSLHCQVESCTEGWTSSTETIVLKAEIVARQPDGGITREQIRARSVTAATHHYFTKSSAPIKRQGIVSDSDW